MTKGKFIVLEGIDNCGKTTQAKLLEKYFQEQGTIPDKHRHVVTGVSVK